MFKEEDGLDHRIIDAACALITIDREKKDLDEVTFKKAIDLFKDLRMYTLHFEPRMLELSQQYLTQWVEKEAAEKSAGEYAHAALKLMDEEYIRVDRFCLPSSTKRDLGTLMQDLVVSKRQAKLSTSSSPFACCY
jgi:cullin-4